ncbi:hypothetical protein GGX14DRAFT_407627 [Mycena pura]|uniref:Uncharacterized protein n=1 Tax=Mycena pura TaxID=153505 RepID=A0AAD6URS7_9AGAR|nr:hypothetical protein GGX14DRAFT_407627 [Mycena pura]
MHPHPHTRCATDTGTEWGRSGVGGGGRMRGLAGARYCGALWSHVPALSGLMPVRALSGVNGGCAGRRRGCEQSVQARPHKDRHHSEVGHSVAAPGLVGGYGAHDVVGDDEQDGAGNVGADACERPPSGLCQTDICTLNIDLDDELSPAGDVDGRAQLSPPKRDPDAWWQISPERCTAAVEGAPDLVALVDRDSPSGFGATCVIA